MNMKFLLDENIPYALIDFLEKKGFMAEHLKLIGKQGIKNGEIYGIAENKKMWIVTRDADFQNLKRFYNHSIAGIILFKLKKTKTRYLLNAMDKILQKYSSKLKRKNLLIVEDGEIRVYEDEK